MDFDAFEALLEVFQVFLAFGQIDLVGDDAPRALGQLLGVEGDFLAHDFQVGHGITAFGSCGIDDEKQHTAAHDVAQEIMAEADVFVRAFDEAGNVRQAATAVGSELDHADHGLQRGEGVVGDLGLGGAELGEQRGFASIRRTDKAGIRDAAHFKVEVALFSGGAGGELARGLVGGGLKVDVPLPAFAALAEHVGGVGFGQVGHGLVAGDEFVRCVVVFLDDAADERARRHFVHHILAAAPGALLGAAFGAVLGQEAVVEDVVAQAVGAGVHQQDEAAAVSAVTTVRAAFGAKLSAMKMGAAIAAFSGAGVDFDLIDKHGTVQLAGDGQVSKAQLCGHGYCAAASLSSEATLATGG